MSSKQINNRFFNRFNDLGINENKELPRITTEESEKLFPPRDEGLKVLLINAPIREWSYPNIMPIGQGYVGSVVVMDGHKLDILDLNAMRKEPYKGSSEEFSKWVEDCVVEKLTQDKPDVIGIGGIVTQYGRIKQITKICKKIYPNVPIVLGGGVSSCYPDFMLKRLSIDIAVLKEAEITFSELLYYLEKGKSLEGLQGVAFKQKSGEIINNGLRGAVRALETGLDTLPWPIRSRWPIEEVYAKNPVGHVNIHTKWIDGKPTGDVPKSMAMIASRGCPYAVKACDYCYAAYLGNIYRLRSPKEVADEMEYITRHYDLGYIHFMDDLLMTDYRWAMALCEELLDRKKKTGFYVEWGGACRTNIIADDVIRAKKQNRPNILELAHEAGMRCVGFGVETASPIILKSIDKSGQTVEKIKIAVRETQRVMGYAECSFMIGSPGESQETVKETVDVCKELGLKPEVFFFVTAYPATSFWDLALEKGLITKAVTGKKGPADEDMIEKYLLRLGEQGESVRTNFSDLPDQEIVDLSWWAIRELKAKNTVRHDEKKIDLEIFEGNKENSTMSASKMDI